MRLFVFCSLQLGKSKDVGKLVALQNFLNSIDLMVNMFVKFHVNVIRIIYFLRT